MFVEFPSSVYGHLVDTRRTLGGIGDVTSNISLNKKEYTNHIWFWWPPPPPTPSSICHLFDAAFHMHAHGTCLAGASYFKCLPNAWQSFAKQHLISNGQATVKQLTYAWYLLDNCLVMIARHLESKCMYHAKWVACNWQAASSGWQSLEGNESETDP